MSSLRESDPVVVARFLDVPVKLVQEQLDSMSPRLYEYMETLFASYLVSNELA